MLLKIFFTFLVILALFFGLQQLIERWTYGFCLQKIFAADIPFKEGWETAPPDVDVLRRLDQPYFFLGAGSECFAFLSADGKSVIKFFKLDTMRPVYLLRGLFVEDYSDWGKDLSSLSPIQRVLGMRAFRIQRTFDSLKLSYDHLKDQTGLLYLHLNPKKEVNKTITVYDPCGIAHQIDLRTTRFFLQERAISLRTHLLDLKENGQWEEACRCVDSLCHLIIQRARQGFSDRDPRIKNFGFIATRALEIDAGSFAPCAEMKNPYVYRQELFFATTELHEWAQQYYPQLAEYLSHHLEKMLSIYTEGGFKIRAPHVTIP